jgi:inhibitor of the pro-sigma K processing machinery
VTDILWFMGAVILVIVALQAFAAPSAIILRIFVSSIIGGCSLWGANLLGGLVGFQVGLNPASAILVGTLGVPGFLGLSVIRLFLG